MKAAIRRYKWTKDTHVTGVYLRERQAVERAIEETKKLSNAEDRLKVIDAVFWKRSHTLEGAAQLVPCSYRTAQRWHSDFVRAVARNFKCNGLL